MSRPFSQPLSPANLAALEQTQSLVAAACELARGVDGRDETAVAQQQLQDMGQMLATRVRSQRVEPRLAHLHDLLFDELGFVGDSVTYDTLENALLPSVLKRRRGLPIVLALIYKVVGEAIGLKVYGINAPGHFLAAVDMQSRETLPDLSQFDYSLPEGLMLVDVFDVGRVLTQQEALTRVMQTSGIVSQPTQPLLRPTSHRQWLERMIRNVLLRVRAEGKLTEAATMQRCLQQLKVLAG